MQLLLLEPVSTSFQQFYSCTERPKLELELLCNWPNHNCWFGPNWLQFSPVPVFFWFSQLDFKSLDLHCLFVSKILELGLNSCREYKSRLQDVESILKTLLIYYSDGAWTICTCHMSTQLLHYYCSTYSNHPCIVTCHIILIIGSMAETVVSYPNC